MPIHSSSYYFSRCIIFLRQLQPLLRNRVNSVVKMFNANPLTMFSKLKLTGLICLVATLSACEEEGDRQTRLEMTIHPTIGYGGPVMSTTFREVLVFSESGQEETKHLVDIITEDFDFTYTLGYEYKFMVDKIKMVDPPQDVSNIKYRFVGPLSKRQVITQDKEETLTLQINPTRVPFVANYSNPDRGLVQALKCTDIATNKLYVIENIEDFTYEEGYTYKVRVKKIVQASPYSEHYRLEDIVEKNEVRSL